MSELDEFRATYFAECAELLGELEEQFGAIEAGDHDAARVNAVFRAVHSIKGGAGAFGFSVLVGFAHAYETLLDEVRQGHVDMSGEVVALCIRANDIVADFVGSARDGDTLPSEHGASERALFDALCAGGGEESGEETFDIAFTPVRVALGGDAFEEPPLEALSRFVVSFSPEADFYRRANDPLLLIRELETLGAATIEAQVGNLPEVADFDGFASYCRWTVTLQGSVADETALREVFEFVDGLCALDISCVADGVVVDAPGTAPVLTDVDRLDPSPAEGLSFAGLGDEISAAQESNPRETSEPAAVEARAVTAPPPPPSIRVDLDKVDRVVNMVGELVIAQSMLGQQLDEALRARYSELVRGLEVLAQTTRGLQDAVMAIRAQPVKSVFSRLPRLLRDLAARTGKKIRLETVGEATEIDRTIIEQLSDPLTHMIRNAADHGIEPPEQRVALGKPETGIVRVSAEQAGGSILIVVEDDGAGINRSRVLQLARERGLVAADAQPSDEQIDNMIFAPGFSTAEAVSDISGRGVGMDVVISNIQKIGGSVAVRSVPGRGTRMTLRLPLTLAVLDVMLVTIAGCPYVIPLSSIVETMQASRSDFGRVPSGGQVLSVRGAYVQVIDVARRFSLAGATRSDKGFVVLCEAEGESRVALVVDEIVGQQQVVIKSLEENFERIEGIAGGTILGDGSVALILDIQGLRMPAALRGAA